jgi:Domain of unknown function (DUF4304)
MEAAKSFKHLKVCLAKRLAPSGFVADGDIVSRKMHDTLVVIEVQKDRKYSTKEEIRFTVNVGISADALREVAAVAVGSSSSDVPPPEKCHWRQRLGHLLPAQSDVWWSVRDAQTAQVACYEIAAGLTDIALPKVEAVASSDALVNAWQEGRGQGLTEYERRASLARLLMALGRKEEAQAAVQALEEASLGKSWAVSAAYDVKELRKQLLS